MQVMNDAQRAWCATCSRAIAPIRRRCRPAGSPTGDVAEPGGEARRIGDFIAGMTDRFALNEHQRLFDSSPELR